MSDSDAHGLLALLPDAHAHPQLDVDHLERAARLRIPCVAAMGVAANVDWAGVARLAALQGTTKVIPGFGIHPWWSHLHASEVGATWEELLEGPSPEAVAHAVALLRRRRSEGAAAAAGSSDSGRREPAAVQDASEQYTLSRQSGGNSSGPGTAASKQAPSCGNASNSDGACSPLGDSDGAGASGGDDDGTGGASNGRGTGCLDMVPLAVWQARLQSLLQSHPAALVGEVGIDRSAVIPGTKARVRFNHQLALLRRQLGIAATTRRPVSVHCVKGYGHLLELFRGLAVQETRGQVSSGERANDGGSGVGGGPTGLGSSPNAAAVSGSAAPDRSAESGAPLLPPTIMLHSYGGSPEEVARFTRLPGVGPRFFFSFSAAINGRTPDKLRARIAAVPDDRLLLESDQVTPLLIDDGMAAICAIVADAKGWSLGETARRTHANFNAFYGL